MKELREFFERDGGRKVSASELLDFKHACSEKEYDAYVQAAREANTTARLEPLFSGQY